VKVLQWVVIASLIVPLSLQAQIRVAVEDGSGNGTGSDIVAQLNDDTWADFTATLVTAADIDTSGELANYDVVILGGSGSNNADWTLDMANALSTFVTSGGGAILTGWGNFDMQSADPITTVLEAIFPTQNIPSTDQFDNSGALLEITQAHPITTGLSDYSVGSGCCTELNPLAPEAGDTVLATMDGSNAGAGSTAVAVKNPGNGFTVYLGHVYMGSTGYLVAPLRTGNPDRLLEQAAVWAASGDVETPDTAVFKVTKTFSDGSTDNVDVALTCTAGLPLQQSFTIAGGDPSGVSFTVTDIAPGGATCTVEESGGPDGYTTVMNGGTGCSWDGVTGGVFICSIENIADAATFTVSMEWVVDAQGGGNAFDDEVPVTIWCDSEISPFTGTDSGDWYYETTLGDGDSAVVTVDTTAGSASCWATQDAMQVGGVESTDDCGPQPVGAGEPVSCTFTNSLFYEGIPTLSQYGMAILALLMLGMGFVGFRRFA